VPTTRAARWAAVALAGCLVLLAACSSSSEGDTASAGTAADGTTAVDVQLSWLPTAGFAGEYAADANELFAAEGLDVTLVPGGPQVASIPSVTSGTALLTWATPDAVVAANAEGADVRIVGSVMKQAPYAITSLASAPIRTPQDMVGKRIGVQPNNELLWDTFLEINDIDPASITKVVAGFDPAPLAAGEVDGWMSYATDEPITLELQGVDTEVMLLADHGFAGLGQAIVVTSDALADPESLALIAAYVRASQAGWQAVLDDPELGATLTVEEYGKDQGIPMDQALGYLDAMAPLITSGGGPLLELDTATKEAVIATLAAGGLTTTVDELFSDVVWEEIGA
jgi:ABC-type nitrate/sulfonate/bicarbonate transport system substrate-binding protein